MVCVDSGSFVPLEVVLFVSWKGVLPTRLISALILV